MVVASLPAAILQVTVADVNVVGVTEPSHREADTTTAAID